MEHVQSPLKIGSRTRSLALAPHFFAVALILGVGLCYALTLRADHVWRSDASLYIAHAENIATGQPYAETGYIYNPDYPSYSPRTYPPIFPVLLAPVYALVGLNLAAMKLYIVGFLVAALSVIYVFLLKYLSSPASALLTLAVGLHPQVWRIKEEIISDIPFLFFCFAAILLVEQVLQQRRGQQSYDHKMVLSGVIMDMLIGCVLYVCYGVRSIGGSIAVSYLVYLLMTFKRTFIRHMIPIFVFGLLLLGQRSLFSADASYFDQIQLSASSVMRNILHYRDTLFLVRGGKSGYVLGIVVPSIIYSLSISGFVYKLYKNPSFVDVFFVLYTTVILIWPANQDRFVLPLLPLLLLYAVYALQRCTVLLQRTYATASTLLPALALCGTLLLTYYPFYRAYEYGEVAGIRSAASIELFDYVRKQIPATDVVVCRDPRTLALFTGRNAVVYRNPRRDSDLWNLFARYDARYIVVGGFGPEDGFGADQEHLKPFIQKHRKRFDRVFANQSFQVYQLVNAP